MGCDVNEVTERLENEQSSLLLQTPSLHTEMVMHCRPTSYTNNRTCQTAYKYTGITICYKNDKFVFEGNKSKVVRGTVLT